MSESSPVSESNPSLEEKDAGEPNVVTREEYEALQRQSEELAKRLNETAEMQAQAIERMTEQYLNSLPPERQAAARAYLESKRRDAEIQQLQQTAAERYKRAIAKELAVEGREYGVTEAELLKFDSEEEMRLHLREARVRYLEEQVQQSQVASKPVERPGGSRGASLKEEPKTLEEWLLKGWEEEGFVVGSA